VPHLLLQGPGPCVYSFLRSNDQCAPWQYLRIDCAVLASPVGMLAEQRQSTRHEELALPRHTVMSLLC
jgi:hypothetical protein